MAHGVQIYNSFGNVIIDDVFPTMVAKKQGYLDKWFGEQFNNQDGYHMYDCGSPWAAFAYYFSSADYPFDPSEYDPPVERNPNPQIFGYLGGHCTVFGNNPPSDDYTHLGNAIPFARLRQGQKLSLTAYAPSVGKEGGKGPFYGYETTDPQLEYALVCPRSLLPPPTGTGMGVYDNAGVCTWDAESAVGHITDYQTFLPYETVYNHTPGAEWVSMPVGQAARGYVPGSYNGDKSTFVTMMLERLSSSQVKLTVVDSQRVGNGGGDSDAPPLGGPIMVGKF